MRKSWTIAALAAASFLVYLFWLPNVSRLKTENPQTTALMDLRQKQAAKKNKKFAIRHTWRPIQQISPTLARAVLLAEDDTFYQHRGFDWEQIKIAIKLNLKKKRYAYGGSTLTQQLARTLYLSPRKSIFRKAKEAMITLWMESVLTKKRILEIYLNSVEWGDGIFGIEAAAQHYYGKSSYELTSAESVALASILPSPRKWSPHRETPFMIKRRANLLSRMGEFEPAPAAEKEKEAEIIFGEEAPEEEEYEVLESTAPEAAPAYEVKPSSP